MPPWNPANYLVYGDHRTRPSHDLAARIRLEKPARVVDLGCGPGNSTAVLRARWPQAEITGVDSSPEMLVRARADYPNERWQEADVSTWSAEPLADVVFSNACLQWVPDHAKLMPRLMASVASGGAFAIQLPFVFDLAIYQAILRLSEDPRWNHLMGPARTTFRSASVEFYYDLLAPLACEMDIWQARYYHVLESPQAILDWMRSTGLRPYLDALPTEEDRATFEALLLEEARRDYPPRVDGKVLFMFPRLFVIAYKA